MSTDTWVHRFVRIGVRPLVDTRVSPNQLTTVRLLIGLGACAGFAIGEKHVVAAAGTLFLISALLDRADGELARLSARTSHRGRLYDLVADCLVTALVFVCIGIGTRDSALGAWSIVMGCVASASVVVMFWLVECLHAGGGRDNPLPSVAGVDLDDALFFIPVFAWLDGLPPLLVLAAVAAPLCAVTLFLVFGTELTAGARR